ncbi:YfhE family protein [Bacillus piscicola]|nr:YfhE family protein [Bacillus piscicola]
MAEEKAPHKQITDKNNGLSSAQEVIYPHEFKKADSDYKDVKTRK